MNRYGIAGLLALVTLLMIAGCRKSANVDHLKKELLETDRSFSKMSFEKGMNQAFLEYISEDGVLLRPNRMPVIGREKITELFSRPDTTFSLTWEPMYSDVSRSGDMGYTYGLYKVEMYSPDGDPITSEGTYVSVWKKNEDGKWKFVLDAGNQGTGKKTGEAK